MAGDAGGVVETTAPPDQSGAAHGMCLNLLAVRARTRGELATRLRTRGVPDEVTGPVLDRLESAGLINDADFATEFVAARRRDRGLASAELVRQLSAKGVDRAIAINAVDHLDADSERETARRLALRKAAAMANLDDAAKSRRLFGLLARKGYSASVCHSVLREVLSVELDPTGDS